MKISFFLSAAFLFPLICSMQFDDTAVFRQAQGGWGRGGDLLYLLAICGIFLPFYRLENHVLATADFRRQWRGFQVVIVVVLFVAIIFVIISVVILFVVVVVLDFLGFGSDREGLSDHVMKSVFNLISARGAAFVVRNAQLTGQSPSVHWGDLIRKNELIKQVAFHWLSFPESRLSPKMIFKSKFPIDIRGISIFALNKASYAAKK